ncbi:MAG: hypothetical protein A3K06_01675 [Candidatus Doudnabacteria bacterium RIFCSPHIGHO2_01_52_17]|uniref:Uncharacterized protein n=1 Tax=Candidatus Doudnabacteria bacterium RIFCSPHIGHO2_01_52_17 TaxID=1817820 RepID=A0A1F5NEL7_9BACT|nr:MAG: hypothetical protein UY73_C0011G0005 [Parcubacteria group bacterium GW2011_GWA2_52_8]OGE76096.1 MAG: hypothetical protein A3K06_01675 [Candidatus Doudnabacteria bacterium RIFCSPHIGHO2_01_52_17]
MGFFGKIFGNKEEADYQATVAPVFDSFMAEINDPFNGLVAVESENKEVRDFFKTILDATERSLRGILYMAPEEFRFKKTITKEEVDSWFRKVSLALVAYSYYFFSVEEQSSLGQSSFRMYWQRMFDSYNKIFSENITIDDVNHYAAGLKEDGEKGYSKSGNLEQALELMTKDYATIAIELLEKIWHEDTDQKVLSNLRKYKPGHGMENLDPKVKKVVFLGDRIWQAHRQIVQPFLPKLLTD